jgi:hypothetical protein
MAVLSAFGGDAVGAVLSTGPGPSGHHRGPVIAVVNWPIEFRCLHITGGHAQAGEEQRTARGGDVGSAIRGNGRPPTATGRAMHAVYYSPFRARVLRVQCRGSVAVRRFWGLPRQSGGPPMGYPVARVSLRPDPGDPGDRSGRAGADPTGRPRTSVLIGRRRQRSRPHRPSAAPTDQPSRTPTSSVHSGS